MQFQAMYRARLESMLRLSPTFRRQCLRIAADLTVTVRLHSTAALWMHAARAMTNFERANGRIEADVYFTGIEDMPELIAHEFEHIIEQIDQIDLALLATLPGTGVYRADSEGLMFETTRATRAGLAVERELREFYRKAD
jgi:hypothetical protein